jgi:hypothetical protein
MCFFIVKNTNAQQKFEVYSCFSESFRILSYDKSDSSLQNAISLSTNDIKVKSINGGVRYRIFDKKYLSFKAGVEVNALGFMDKRITDVRWPSEIKPDGYVFDPTLPHDIQTGRKLIYFDLPLAGEIKKSWGKWTPIIQLELVPQYLITIKSITKTEFGKKSNFQKPTGNVDRFNLALGFSFGSYYNLSDNWSFMINFFYRKQLLGIINAPITAKLYAFGFNAGVSFNL